MDYELIKPDEQDAYDVAPFLSYARAQRSAKAERDPVIGDAVHLWLDNACRAAIVTEDDLFTATLSYLMPRESHWTPIEGVPHEEVKGEAISWHWPCGGQ